MLARFSKILVGASLSLALGACGSEKFQSLQTRMVPVAPIPEVANQPDVPIEELDQIEEDIQQEQEELIDEVVSEDPAKISLRDKILANSDVSEKALDNAFAYFDANHSKISNKNYMTIFDIGLHSGSRRLYIINLETGTVSDIHVAHAKNSDINHTGVATSFSNVNGSNKSSLGFMLTAERYTGSHGLSMRLDGLESRNSNVRSRAIVVHGASYVSPSLSKMGRSLGCPAVSDPNISWVVKALENGSLFYIFHNEYD